MLQLEELNEFWGIGGFAVGVIALILSIVFYLCGKKRQLLEHQTTSIQLITKRMSNISGLTITFNNAPIENLTSTTIKFINSGNQTIHSSDFASMEPLSIVVNGCFYSLKNSCKIESDNPNSTPQIEILNMNTAYIQFDFLKPKQSFSITLLHNGKLIIEGELKNGTRREYRSHNNIYAIVKLISYFVLTSFLLLVSNKYLSPTLTICLALSIISSNGRLIGYELSK